MVHSNDASYNGLGDVMHEPKVSTLHSLRIWSGGWLIHAYLEII